MKGPQGLPDRNPLRRLVTHVVLVPLVVFVFLLSATWFVWQELNRYHLMQKIADSNKHLEFVSVHLAAHLEVRMVLGELIRQEWLDYYPTSAEGFTAIVKPKLQRFPDIQAINWVDAEGVIRWVNPLQGNEQAMGLDIRKLPLPNAALSAAARTGEPQVTAPISLAQGGRGFVVYIPVIHDNHLEGFINMVFRSETLIDTALSIEERRDTDLHIRDGDSVVYDNHTESHLAVESQKDLKVGNRVWTISVAPTVLNREAFSEAGNQILLLIGLLFSIVLPLMLYQMLRRNVELRESQRRFADYADISSDWFWETDENLRFSYFSQRFEEVTGVPPDRFLGKTRREIGAPEADPQEYQKILECMDNHQPYRDFEHTRVKPDGSRTFLSISARPAFDSNGDFIGYRGVGKDITDRKQNQKVLNDALLASEQANRAKSEFLATMSHEFRTPLNAIIGFSEMLKEEYFGKLGAPNYREYAADIHNSGQHMLDLVNDILDFSAIEASKRQMTYEDFSFEDILKDGVRNVENQIMQKDMILKKELAEDLPMLHADKRSVYQIVLNLLSNAVKFTGPDGTITVSAYVEDGAFVFSISDTGTGIPADKLSSITEPFTQTHRDPHVSGTGAGTGLGLTIVKSLVEAHGGRLEVESTLGVGTRVTVILPQPAG